MIWAEEHNMTVKETIVNSAKGKYLNRVDKRRYFNLKQELKDLRAQQLESIDTDTINILGIKKAKIVEELNVIKKQQRNE